MHEAEFILYVADQARARAFYRTVLGSEPTLDVDGMTEFDLGGATLGLMPGEDMVALLDGRIDTSGGQRCELYLRRPDAVAALDRGRDAGGVVLEELAPRPWGDTVGYVLDLDGHVVALALPG